MDKSTRGSADVAAIALSIVTLAACANRAQPPPLNGSYTMFVDFSKQTFNGVPTPMDSKTFPVDYTTRCDASGCVVVMDNSGEFINTKRSNKFKIERLKITSDA